MTTYHNQLYTRYLTPYHHSVYTASHCKTANFSLWYCLFCPLIWCILHPDKGIIRPQYGLYCNAETNTRRRSIAWYGWKTVNRGTSFIWNDRAGWFFRLLNLTFRKGSFGLYFLTKVNLWQNINRPASMCWCLRNGIYTPLCRKEKGPRYRAQYV